MASVTSPESRLEPLLLQLPHRPAAAEAAVARLGREAIADDARALGLLPLLSHYLPTEFSLSRKEEYAAKFCAARMESTTLEAVRSLENAGVEAIALKGAVHAARLYPKPWLRPSGDVDLFVRAKHCDRAKVVLKRNGWRLDYDPRKFPLDFQHSVNFVGRNRLMLELHWILTSGFQGRFESEQVFARSRWQTLSGGPVRILGPNDDVVFQAAHAAAHAFRGAKWLFDLKLTLQRSDYCWDEVIALARAARVSAAVGMALYEARRRVGADVPAWVLERLAPGLLRRMVARGLDALPDENAWLRSSGLGLLLTDKVSTRWGLQMMGPGLKRMALGANHIGRKLGTGPLVSERFQPAWSRRG